MRRQLKTKSLCLSSPADKASVNTSRLEWEEEMVHERKMEERKTRRLHFHPNVSHFYLKFNKTG